MQVISKPPTTTTNPLMQPEENIYDSQESSSEQVEIKPFFEKYQEYLETTSESEKESETYPILKWMSQHLEKKM